MVDIPTPHKTVVTADGITKWRAATDGLSVLPAADGGKLLTLTRDGEVVARFALTVGDAEHLATLLRRQA